MLGEQRQQIKTPSKPLSYLCKFLINIVRRRIVFLYLVKLLHVNNIRAIVGEIVGLELYLELNVTSFKY